MSAIESETPTEAAESTKAPSEPAKIRTRILAMAYDGLIILFITTISVMIIQGMLIGGKEIPPDHILNKILKPFWFVPGFFYLAYYWTKSGQTPSMKIWKIKLINKHGKLVSWPQALLRYITAILGLGLIWAFFNKKRSSLQDIISNSSLLVTNDIEE